MFLFVLLSRDLPCLRCDGGNLTVVWWFATQATWCDLQLCTAQRAMEPSFAVPCRLPTSTAPDVGNIFCGGRQRARHDSALIMFEIFDTPVVDVAIFAHGSLRAPACFGGVFCLHRCTLSECGGDVRGDVSRALSGHVLARCLLLPCGMLSHVCCFRIARQVEESRRMSHAALSQRDPGNLKSEIEMEKAEGNERSRDRARHCHRLVRSTLQRACVACKRVLAPVCLSSFVDEPAKILLIALHHVVSEASVLYCNCGIWTYADRHRRELALSGLVNAQDGVPRAS